MKELFESSYISMMSDINAELRKENERLNNRIEKAVEYLKSQEDNLFMSFSNDFLDHDELITKKIGMTLLNILNGRSDTNVKD